MTESLVIPKAEGKSAVGTCAEHINIPESYSTDGIANTDLALIVTGMYEPLDIRHLILIQHVQQQSIPLHGP